MVTTAAATGSIRTAMSQRRIWHSERYLHEGNTLLRKEFKRHGNVFARFYAFFSKALVSHAANRVAMIRNCIR